MRSVLAFLLRVLLRVKVVGDVTPIARGEKVLIVSNHRSPLDALLLGLILPSHACVIVSPAEAKGALVRWALRSIGHLVLDVTSPRAVKRMLKLLQTGSALVVFPEGSVNPSSAVGKVYPVPAVVAARSGARVVPVHIGSRSEWSRRNGASLWRTTVYVYPPQQMERSDAGSARRRRIEAARKLTHILHSATLGAYPLKPLFECFLDACDAHGRGAPLLQDQSGDIQSYGRVLRASLALGRLLSRYTADGERVGVLLPNVMATVSAVLGLSAVGRVPAMLNYSSGASGVKAARAVAGVRTVITSRRFVEQARLQPLIEALREATIVYLEDLRAEFGLFDKLWLALFALRFPRRIVPRLSPLSPAVVLFTSGSEGQPKGVVLSHRAVVANVAQMRTVIDFTPADKILNPLPLYHAYSFTAGMTLPLLTGTRLYLYLSPLHYRAIPEIAYRSGCTVLFGTSTFLAYYAAHAHPLDFSRLRYVISGGETLSPEVARTWMEKFGLRIFEGYGCTECAPVVSLATPGAYRAGAVGRFLPGIEWRIEPMEGIAHGGVLHVRGPNIMLGHLLQEHPGALRPCRSEAGAGWYDTGDIVELDADGFLTIHGRMKRFAKVAGEMISLDQVEQVARKASPAHHHAAILSFSEFGGETTVLFTTDTALDPMALHRAARELEFRDLAVARRLVPMRELPVLPSGKTDYVSLVRLARFPGPGEEDSACVALRPAQGRAAASAKISITR